MTTTNPSTDWEKEYDAIVATNIGDAYLNELTKNFIRTLLSRKEEEVRKAENNAWMMGFRCQECGGNTENDLSDMCAKCFEEA